MDKIKLFFLSDDIRATSGVSNQANKLLIGLAKTGKYDIVHGAVAINHNRAPFNGKFTNFHDIKVYNLSSIEKRAGEVGVIKWILDTEEPDIFVCFGDPHFFIHIYQKDNEIRNKCKFVLYHTWDNAPFPKYNIPWYNSCDYVATISKLSHELLASNGVHNTYIPHGYDPSEFYPLTEEEKTKAKEAFFVQLKDKFPNHKFKKVIFWNNRNLERKRPLDLMRAFAEYCKKHNDTVLLMHTDPVGFGGGTDLLSFYDSIDDGNVPIAFSERKLDSSRLNMLYNMADISVNISHSEGFGLCIGESLLAGTPVLATKTGGMSEQMTDGENAWGLLLEPDLRTLTGFVATPFIYQDYVSKDAIVAGFEYLLRNPALLAVEGANGRLFITQKYHTDDIIKKWDTYLGNIHAEDSHYKKYEIIKI